MVTFASMHTITLSFLLAGSGALVVLAGITSLRPAHGNAPMAYSFALTSLCLAFWLAVDALPAAAGTARVLVPVVLASFGVAAALWLRVAMRNRAASRRAR